MPAKLEIVPPEEVMSVARKSVTVSLRVKLTTEDSPAFKLLSAAVTAMVGLIVLTLIVLTLSASAPSALIFPAASANLLLATLMTPLVVLSAVGVNTTPQVGHRSKIQQFHILLVLLVRGIQD